MCVAKSNIPFGIVGIVEVICSDCNVFGLVVLFAKKPNAPITRVIKVNADLLFFSENEIQL